MVAYQLELGTTEQHDTTTTTTTTRSLTCHMSAISHCGHVMANSGYNELCTIEKQNSKNMLYNCNRPTGYNSGGLQGPIVLGPRRPLHVWPPVKSATVSLYELVVNGMVNVDFYGAIVTKVSNALKGLI